MRPTSGLWAGKKERKKERKTGINVFFLSLFRLKNEKKDLVVPRQFVALLKSIFAKLVGAKAINPQLVNASFWSGMPAKFRARKPRGSVSEEK